MPCPGQNVYVRGARGTGRITMVRQILNDLQPQTDSKRDFCYVHNFSRADHPSLITLPPGKAPGFRREMVQVAEFFEEGLTKALDSEPHLSNRHAVQDRVKELIKKTTEPLEKEIESNGMALVSVQQGPASQTMILPVVDGKPIPFEQFRTLVTQGEASEEQLKAFEEALPPYQKRLQETSRKVNGIIREAGREVFELNEKIARQLAEEFTAPILEKFSTPQVETFIREVIDDVVENHLQSGNEQKPDFKELYGVNVILSHDDATLVLSLKKTLPA